ncbi:unnamed protein product [Arctia plantaginis]|uniref:Uncharacterized protein n=1 Tax=Arctia plantaginis TaxID=874455 RepID=A0A8S1ALP5_ARCPL|nr:unnamed protein product [Arctia plantaginis]
MSTRVPQAIQRHGGPAAAAAGAAGAAARGRGGAALLGRRAPRPARAHEQAVRGDAGGVSAVGELPRPARWDSTGAEYDRVRVAVDLCRVGRQASDRGREAQPPLGNIVLLSFLFLHPAAGDPAP